MLSFLLCAIYSVTLKMLLVMLWKYIFKTTLKVPITGEKQNFPCTTKFKIRQKIPVSH